jgi:hypothetical protein
MARVFFRTYGSGARGNANKTLRKAVTVERLIQKVRDSRTREQLEQYRVRGDLRLWGVGCHDSRLQLKQGDIFLILLKNAALYYSEVVETLSDPAGEVGYAVNWTRYPRNQHWRPVLLTNVFDISGLLDVVNDSRKRAQLVARTKFYQLAG